MTGQTTVAIRGEDFWINGAPTDAGRSWNGHRIEGLLLNARMVQAIFDDVNPATRGRWAYPDTAEWDPERYKDTYRERVIDLVRAKAEGREIVESKLPEPAAKVDDLMAALEASLAAATKQATSKKTPAKKPRRAAASKQS